jgi:hypothetical protein
MIQYGIMSRYANDIPSIEYLSLFFVRFFGALFIDSFIHPLPRFSSFSPPSLLLPFSPSPPLFLLSSPSLHLLLSSFSPSLLLSTCRIFWRLVNLGGAIDSIEETIVQVKVVNILVRKAYSGLNLHPTRLKAAQLALLKILELDDSSIFEKARLVMLNSAPDFTPSSSDSPSAALNGSFCTDPTQASPFTRARHTGGSQSSVLDRRMSRGRAVPQPPFSIRNTSSADLQGEVEL